MFCQEQSLSNYGYSLKTQTNPTSPHPQSVGFEPTQIQIALPVVSSSIGRKLYVEDVQASTPVIKLLSDRPGDLIYLNFFLHPRSLTQGL